MSRSVKKNPVQKYAPKSGRWGKQQANKKVRRFRGELSNGCNYKDLYDRWNIHDCRDRTTLNEHLERWGGWIMFCEERGYEVSENDYYGKTLQGAINKWKSCYVRK